MLKFSSKELRKQYLAFKEILTPKTHFTKVMKHYPLLGARDAFSLVSFIPLLLISSPFFATSSNILILSLILVFFGAIGLSLQRIVYAYDEIDLENRIGFVLPSDPIPEVKKGGGILIGYTKDTNEPVHIPYEILTRHLAIVGASGVGKTVLGMSILNQHMNLGGGFMMIDAKIDGDTRDTLGYLAEKAGRKSEFYLLNIDDPKNSNTYNPLLNGDADEVASRLLNLLGSTEGNPGSDHYKQQVNHALVSIIGGFKAARIRYHMEDLMTFFQSPVAIEDLLTKTPKNSKEKRDLEIFLNKYRKLDNQGNVTFDMIRIANDFSGFVGRLAVFAQGKFGKIFNTYTPEIDLFDIISNNKMLYIMLPTMGKSTAALNLAKMIISDVMSTVYRVQALPKNKRPKPPFLNFWDEYGRYAIAESAILFEQARSAGVAMIPGFQGYGNLEDVSTGFADMILQSTWSKALFRFGSDTSSERSADIIGKIKRSQSTFTDSESKSDGAQYLQYSPQSTANDGIGMGESWREIEEHRVSIDKLSSIEIGECILTIAGEVYHLKIPKVSTPIDDESEGDVRKPEYIFKVNKFKTTMPYGEKGFDTAKRFERYLLANSPQAQEQRKRNALKAREKERRAAQKASK